MDVLYNDTGIMPPDDDSILATKPVAWDRVLAVNARGGPDHGDVTPE